jgi:hypothetical protein
MAAMDAVQEIVREFYDSGLTWGEVPGLLMSVIDHNNVDDVILAFPLSFVIIS